MSTKLARTIVVEILSMFPPKEVVDEALSRVKHGYESFKTCFEGMKRNEIKQFCERMKLI